MRHFTVLIRHGEFAQNVINWRLNVKYKNSISSSILWGRVFWNSISITYNFLKETYLCKKWNSITISFLFDTKRHAQFYPIYFAACRAQRNSEFTCRSKINTASGSVLSNTTFPKRLLKIIMVFKTRICDLEIS